MTCGSGVRSREIPSGQSELDVYSFSSSKRRDDTSSPSCVDISDLGVVDLYVSEFDVDTGISENVAGNKNPCSEVSIVPDSAWHLKRSR